MKMLIFVCLLGIALSINLKEHFDPWQVLSADLTCCPTHKTTDSCTNEGGSDCIWVSADTTEGIEQALLFDEGWSDTGGCFGEAYLNCKVDAGDAEACCAPGCVGIAPPGGVPADPSDPASGAVPVCFDKTPTEEPTAQPTTPNCEINVNYAFEGVPCQISGDPHFYMVNGDRHDFQGQPDSTNDDGELQNQFYYVAACDGSDTDDLPYQILGTHYYWGTRAVSGVDYLTIELFGPSNTFFVYFSSAIAAYARQSDSTYADYDVTLTDGGVTDLVSNVPTTIGGYFQLEYEYISSTQSYLTITIDFLHEINIYMVGQMNEVDGRRRMHYVYMTAASVYKCHMCGLCGNYKDSSTGETVETMETCDGSYIEYMAGWNGDTNPGAYDVTGWTYEYNYYNDNCGGAYDPASNIGDLNYVDPCDTTIVDAVEAACLAKVTEESTCCDEVIGGDACTEMQDDCDFDACVIATDLIADGESQDDAIETAVELTLGAGIDQLCDIPDVAEELDAGNLFTYSYLGCYADARSRSFEICMNWKVEDMDTGSCITLCADAGYRYMGLQYGRECFCGNELSSIMQYGSRSGTSDEYKCAEYQDGVGDEAGCWGGRWTSCVYDLEPGNDAFKTKKKTLYNKIIIDDDEQFTVKSNTLIKHNIYQTSLQNGYIQIAILAAAIFIFATITAYYKRNNNNKYIPIADPSTV